MLKIYNKNVKIALGEVPINKLFLGLTEVYSAFIEYKDRYLTFNVISTGTILWKLYGSSAKTISYSKDDGKTWKEITSTSAGVTISAVTGDKILFKGENISYSSSKNDYSAFSGGTALYEIEGNIMSLIYGDNFKDVTTFNGGTYNFCSIFKESKAVSAKNLILPAIVLTDYCYRGMFSKATLLTVAPALPATTLSQGCYWYMFEECPITAAPDLLADTLVAECYGHMFSSCTSLNYIKCMATAGFNTSICKTGWVDNVASSGTFVKASSVEVSTWSRGGNGIPNNWTIYDDEALFTPTISYGGDNVIILSCETSNSTIYYRTNQTGEYTIYTSPITIIEDTYIEAYSVKGSYISSVITENCPYISNNIYEYSNRDLDTWTYNNDVVSAPYSVNRIDGHSANYAKGTFEFETKFVLKKAEPAYLWFLHADQSAIIYVNGTLVTKHWGGYTAFTVDITNFVQAGINTVKVALKNNEGNNLAPADADFNFNATLGNVKLFTSPCLPGINYGYDGFHITSTVSDAEATINIKTSIPTGTTAVCKIDDNNTNIYSLLIVSEGSEITFTKVITNPHLWNGKSDPYLYDITLELYKDNELYHRFVRPYGLRYYEYLIDDTEKIGTSENPYTGFLLNGQPYLLRGVCMHDDIAGKANALDDTDYDNTFAIILELGCNFIRLAHYPHPKEVYDRCDALGIIVLTEVPCVNRLQSTMPEDYYTHLTGQYTDMVNQHYNHPCILFWGLSNETTTNDKTFGNLKINEYTALIKSLDSERWVGYVMSATTDNPSGYYNDPDCDWFGCNTYLGWYTSLNSNNPTTLIQNRINKTVKRINKPVAQSEYGAGGTQLCHSDNPLLTATRGNTCRHDIEYQMWIHEGHIAALKNFPQLLFTSAWQLFDIAVQNRNEGYVKCLDGKYTVVDDNLRRLNDKGLVERDHITKKDTFYLYKAWWNPTPFIHICGKDFNKVDNRVIKCYTNEVGQISLKVNGTVIETATPVNNILEFSPYTFNDGDLITVEGLTQDSFTIQAINYQMTYVPVEYVETTGKQCVDIGCKLMENTDDVQIDIKFKAKTADTLATILTSKVEVDPYPGFVLRNVKGTNVNSVEFVADWQYDSNTTLLEVLGYNPKYYYNELYHKDANDEYVNTNLVNTIVEVSIPISNIPVAECHSLSTYLFATLKEGMMQRYSPTYLYYLKITKGGNIIRDLIPVKATLTSDNGTPIEIGGLYDKIDNKLYTSYGEPLVCGPEILET